MKAIFLFFLLFIIIKIFLCEDTIENTEEEDDYEEEITFNKKRDPPRIRDRNLILDCILSTHGISQELKEFLLINRKMKEIVRISFEPFFSNEIDKKAINNCRKMQYKRILKRRRNRNRRGIKEEL